MGISRREFLKRATSALLVGVSVDSASPQIIAKTSKVDVPKASVEDTEYPQGYENVQGIYCFRRLKFINSSITLVGVLHKGEYVDEHRKFLSALVDRDEPDALLFESEVFVHAPVYRANGLTYFIQLCRPFAKGKRDFDIVDVGGPKKVSSLPFFLKDYVSGFSYSYAFLLSLRELLQRTKDLLLPSLMMGLSWPLFRLTGGDGSIVGAPRNPYELVFDHFTKDLPIDEGSVALLWRRYPKVMQADMFMARAIRRLSSTYGSMVVLTGALHSFGIEVALRNGLDASIGLAREKISILKADGEEVSLRVWLACSC